MGGRAACVKKVGAESVALDILSDAVPDYPSTGQCRSITYQIYHTFFILNLLKFRLLEFLRKIAILELEFLTSFLTNSEFDQFLRDFEIFI